MTRSLEELRNAIDTSAQQPYLSMKGGDFNLVDKFEKFKQDVTEYDKDSKKKYVDVVIVDINPHASRTYYEGEFDEKNPTSPVCYSDNGVAPSRSADSPQAPFCRQCEWNQWGTGKGRGKACKEAKKLAVLVLGQEPKAWRFTVPATSLRAIGGFTRALTTVKVDGMGALPIDVVTRISISKDVLFGLEFDYIRTIRGSDDPDDLALYEIAVAMFESGETADLVGLYDEPIQQQALLTAPAAQRPVQAITHQSAKEAVQAKAQEAMQDTAVIDADYEHADVDKLPPRRKRG